MLASDLPEIVELHMASFPGFFLTFLGRDFLNLLYESINLDPGGLLLVASADGKLAGFIAGVTRQTGFYRNLIGTRVVSFAWAALAAALRRPSIAPRLVRALKRHEESGESSSEACLMSVSVRPEFAGRGVGRALIEAFTSQMKERGINEYCLTTDREKNDGVNEMYRKLGFRLARSFVTPEGRAMNEYVMNLGESC